MYLCFHPLRVRTVHLTSHRIDTIRVRRRRRCLRLISIPSGIPFHRLVTVLSSSFEKRVQGGVDIHQLQQMPTGAGRHDRQITLVLVVVTRDDGGERICQRMD